MFWGHPAEGKSDLSEQKLIVVIAGRLGDGCGRKELAYKCESVSDGLLEEFTLTG